MTDTNQSEREVNLVDLSLQQLNSLKSQLENEVKQIGNSLGGLYEAKTRFQHSKEAIQTLQTCDNKKEVLVPLTSSMFAYGQLSATDEITVDIGTGYYMEYKSDDAKKFVDRKVEFLDTNIASIKEILEGKRKTLGGVMYIMQGKLQSLQSSETKANANVWI